MSEQIYLADQDIFVLSSQALRIFCRLTLLWTLLSFSTSWKPPSRVCSSLCLSVSHHLFSLIPLSHVLPVSWVPPGLQLFCILPLSATACISPLSANSVSSVTTSRYRSARTLQGALYLPYRPVSRSYTPPTTVSCHHHCVRKGGLDTISWGTKTIMHGAKQIIYNQ